MEERDTVKKHASLEYGKLKIIKSHRERLKCELFIKNCIEFILDTELKLKEFLAENKEALDEEYKKLDASADLSLFYDHVKQLKEYHKRFPNEPADINRCERIVESLRVSDGDVEMIFSGEETGGKYVDLNEHFLLFKNIYPQAGYDYLQYLKSLSSLDSVPVDLKLKENYKVYLQGLLDYFKDFTNRALPLVQPKLVTDAEPTGPIQVELEKIDAIPFDPSLYCPYCEKLFTNRNSFTNHLNGKQHLKNAKKADQVEKQTEEIRKIFDALVEEKKRKILEIVNLEANVQYFVTEVLSTHITATYNNIERRQAMTPEELQAEEAREQERLRLKAKSQENQDPSAFQEKDMDGGVYNPLKLPLDWDGKPIPLWLWKLHGLGTKYTCEVCGNHQYLGRKAFDKHFFEWRHAHGMRCLGVPNTRHFFQITRIDEVLSVWEEMKRKRIVQVGSVGTAMHNNNNSNINPEEIEDAQGNVYTKRVYEDMKRQGLI